MGKEKKVTTKKNEVKDEKEIVKKEKTKKVEKKKEVKKDKKKFKKEKKAGVFKSIINFFKGVKSEMSKVAWPSKKDMVKYTIATVVFIIFFALFFYGIILVLGLLKDLIVIL